MQKGELLENPIIKTIISIDHSVYFLHRVSGSSLCYNRKYQHRKIITYKIRWTSSTEQDTCIELVMLPKSGSEGIKRWNS